MRQALGDTRRLVQTAAVASLPAPIGGWNTADGLSAMPPLDAVLMDNFTPEEAGVFLRGGDELFATGMSGAVETLVEFVSPTVNQLLAASDGNVYNATTGTPALIGSGFTNAQWQYANYNGFGFFANGQDTVQQWDGTTLSNSTFSGTTLADLDNVTAVRNRVWFVQKDSGVAWYGPIAGVTGALTSFNVGEIARGGKLVKVDQWSRDAGDGMDDFTVFVMSTGRCLIYQGDPAATFTLVGSFEAPEPIGKRCTTNIGGELVLITEGGYFTMSDIMVGQIRPQDALSSKIRDAVTEAFQAGGSLDGWSVHLSADNRKIIVNYPISAIEFRQHVFNTVTKAWGRWLSRNTYSITIFDNELYGGFAGGEIYRIEAGVVDQSRSNANIEGYCIQAFNTLEGFAPGARYKNITMIQPFIEGSGTINCTVGLLTDYQIRNLESNLNILNPGGLPWEQYTFVNWEDWVLPWGDDVGGVSQLNLSANVIGSAFAVALDADTNQSLRWYSANLTVKPGGI